MVDHTPPPDRRPCALVADDEPHDAKLVQSLLERLGCGSLAVGDGDSALQLLSHRHFDLLVFDVVMPGGGVEFVRHAKRLAPEAPIIFITGFAAHTVTRELARYGPVIPKPFTASSFLQVVTRTLGLPESPAAP